MTRRSTAIVVLALVLAALVYWMQRDRQVDALNEAIARNGSAALRAYPYQFRVLRLENGVATMTTPRSPQVPVYRMIRAIDPNLKPRDTRDPEFVAAEKALAAVQEEARRIVLSQPEVKSVKWELDRNWLIDHGIPVG
ncbi:MAG: hypothetical protein JNK68_10565 [Betaproteobacteria bacterium]|nr:hypothetical protein [Betaproteobacteria bacterium]